MQFFLYNYHITPSFFQEKCKRYHCYHCFIVPAVCVNDIQNCVPSIPIKLYADHTNVFFMEIILML